MATGTGQGAKVHVVDVVTMDRDILYIAKGLLLCSIA